MGKTYRRRETSTNRQWRTKAIRHNLEIRAQKQAAKMSLRLNLLEPNPQ